LAYGVSNTTGAATSLDEISCILDLARRSGIDTLDTAIAYGNAEAVLGQFDLAGFQIVTKLPGIPADTVDVAGWVNGQVERSLERLGVDRVKAVLLHRPDDLFGQFGSALAEALGGLVDQNLVQQTGVSVYSCQQLDQCRTTIPVSIAQLPFNVLDNALIENAKGYQDAGIEIHTRSTFLQGLLLMEPASRNRYFDRWAPVFDQWHNWLRIHDLTAQAACLNYVCDRPEVHRLVIGVQTEAQLQELLSIPRQPLPPLPIWDGGDVTDDLINPTKWALR
ncbi:MAG: aldo/keto reductase, partial [Paracoccaceae bacterium]